MYDYHEAIIVRHDTYGIMSVYRRKHIPVNAGSLMKRYIVIRETDGHIMEEFRMLKSAITWAIDNQNG